MILTDGTTSLDYFETFPTDIKSVGLSLSGGADSALAFYCLLKTLYGFNAINITLGLPFIRVSPDHGPNEKMLGKNLSNHLSLLRSMQFLDF